MSFALPRRVKAVAAAAAATAAAAVGLSATTAQAAPQPIVGGTNTTASAYPYVMQITDADENQFCGGTLVTPTKVVTAAHCVNGDSPANVRVVGGRTYRNGTNGTVAKVSKIWVHPSYQTVTKGDDVAVLTLSTAMPYTTAKYVSSSETGIYAEGATARIVGWGTTSSGGQSSNRLKTATVPVTSDSYCANAYGGRFIASDMVCAGYDEGGVDTCQGDSGGPLMINGRLAGVVSWGDGCADPGVPGIYTRLTTFSSLVTQQVNS
ncbi:S1 family peptidase [Streptomyces sp. P1-3]|uniref:S1 family peptidase n=1 Tax=Streptomyces sp. P1-3 TaxID=3421658 RepID=UPI003D35B62C